MSKLTVVVSGRNDGYDGDFDERLSIALSKNIQSLPKAEFIFVEWNPYLDRPLVSEKLQKVFKNRVRYFVVHPKFHSIYCTIDDFLEYPAKNVGVRRATGDFILCTNSDVVFSPEVARQMQEPLGENVVYRATRVDIRREYLDVKFPLEKQYRLGDNKGYTNAAGDFLLLSKKLWNDTTGYCEDFPEQRLHKDAFIIHVLMDKWGLKMVDLGEVTHWRHPSSWSNNKNRPRVGDIYWDFRKLDWEKNEKPWGLACSREVNRNGIIWLV